MSDKKIDLSALNKVILENNPEENQNISEKVEEKNESFKIDLNSLQNESKKDDKETEEETKNKKITNKNVSKKVKEIVNEDFFIKNNDEIEEKMQTWKDEILDWWIKETEKAKEIVAENNVIEFPAEKISIEAKNFVEQIEEKNLEEASKQEDEDLEKISNSNIKIDLTNIKKIEEKEEFLPKEEEKNEKLEEKFNKEEEKQEEIKKEKSESEIFSNYKTELELEKNYEKNISIKNEKRWSLIKVLMIFLVFIIILLAWYFSKDKWISIFENFTKKENQEQTIKTWVTETNSGKIETNSGKTETNTGKVENNSGNTENNSGSTENTLVIKSGKETITVNWEEIEINYSMDRNWNKTYTYEGQNFKTRIEVENFIEKKNLENLKKSIREKTKQKLKEEFLR